MAKENTDTALMLNSVFTPLKTSTHNVYAVEGNVVNENRCR